MGFWKRVNEEILLYGAVNRKTIAFETGIPIQTINRAIERDSRVYLEDALKVAIVFNKPIDYFLEEPIKLKCIDSTAYENKIKSIKLYYEHQQLINYCEQLNQSERKIILQLAEGLLNKNKEDSN